MSVPSRSILFTMLLTLVVVVGAIIAALQPLNNDAGIAQRRPTWPGPVHNAAGMPVVPMAPDAAEGNVEWADARDDPVNWIDIARVRVSPEGQPQWGIELAAKPPRAGLEAAETVISYGLVFETTGDGRADYVVGINNDAPGRGHFRVWVTDLATGATEEQVGPPYGLPVEFRHPDEAGPGDDPLGSRSMLFTFLPGTTPRGLTGRSPFYAWSAVTSAGETGAWDYAPDSAWLFMPGGR